MAAHYVAVGNGLTYLFSFCHISTELTLQAWW